MTLPNIVAIPSLKDNYIWAIINQVSRRAYIVDPGAAKPVHDFLTTHALELAGILITHHHWDHTDGVKELSTHYHCETVGPGLPAMQIHLLDVIPELTVIPVPGHTLDHILFYSPGILFSGDTLFAAGCGRVREGTMEQMYEGLQKIASLPDETNIYCGHEYTLDNLRFAATVEPDNRFILKKIQRVINLRDRGLPTLPTTLAEEKLTNPFLRTDQPQVIKMVEQHFAQPCHSAVAVFTALRNWKNQF
jgi:hydroxyacylglutathione hydrolase